MKKSPSYPCSSSLILIGSIATLLAAQSAQAVNATWGIAPSSPDWNASNWTGVSVPASGDSLIFGASTQTALNNNLTTGTAWIIPSITFSAGAPAYVISGNSFTLGTSASATVLTNASTNTQTINDNIALGNAVQTISLGAGGGNIVMGGNISGAGTATALTVAGSGTLTLSGSNSYGAGGAFGQTIINSGVTVRATNTSALGGGNLQGLTWAPNGGTYSAVINSGGTLDLRYDTSATFGPGTGAGYSINAFGGAGTSGTATLNIGSINGTATNKTITVGNLTVGGNNNASAVFMLTGSDGYSLKAGILQVNERALFSNNVSGGVTLDGIVLTQGAGWANFNIGGTGTTTVLGNVTGIFSGNVANTTTTAFNKTGTGVVLFNGAINNWGNATTITGGTVSIGGIIGESVAGSVLTVSNTNTGVATDVALNLSSSWTVGNLSGTNSVASSGTNTSTINLNGAGVNLAVKAMGNAAYFGGTIAGTGGLTILPRSRVNNGEVAVTLYGKNTYSGATTLNGGSLILDFSNNSASTPATNIVNNTANNSTLVLGGGGLTVKGKSSTVNSQQFNGVNVKSGGSTITVSQGSATSVLLSLGNITRSRGGGTVDFTNPATVWAANGITTTTENINGILGGWATVGGSNWATNNGANIVALSTYTDDAWAVGNNTTVTTGGALATSSTTNSLRFNAAAANTLTLDGINTITSGGILVTSTVGANASAITGGTLRGASGQDLVVIQNNANAAGALTIGSVIADNTTATGLTKSGSGTLTLTAANTYTGATNINGGVVQISAANGLGDATAATNTIAFNSGGALVTTTGLADLGANRGTLESLSGSYDLGANRSIALNGAGALQVDAGALTVSGVISGDGTLTKTGAGTLILNAANTFTGQLAVTAGILNIRNSWALGSEGIFTNVNALSNTPTTIANGATLQLQGNIHVGNEQIFLNGAGASGQNGALVNVSGVNVLGRSIQTANQSLYLTGNTVISVDAGSLIMNDGIFGASADGGSPGSTQPYTLTLAGSGNGAFVGNASVGGSTSIIKNGTGTWLYNGNTNFAGVTINAGLLAVSNLANGGSASGLGRSANVAGNLVFGGGILRILNSCTSDRSFTINDGVAAGFDIAPSVLVTVSGTAMNQTGAMSTGGLTKFGTGTLALTGTLAYSGTTTVDAGTLKLDFSGANAPASNIVSGAGALALNGGTLNLSGKVGATNSQTFSGLTLGSGPSAIALTATTTNTVTANLGNITRSTGGTLNFTVAPSTSVTIATTTSGNTNDILGTWVTTGTGTSLRYATQTGASNQIGAYSGGVAAANIAALTDMAGTANYDLAAATGSMASTVSANTIRYNGGTATATATDLTLNGLMNAGTGTWTLNGGTLTIGSNLELVVQNNNQGTTIGSTIRDNAGASALTFNSVGGGALTLSGSNTYSGATYINGGTVYINAANNLGASSQININGGSLRSSGNTYDLGSSRTINAGWNGATIQTDSGTMTVSGAVNTGENLLTVAGNANTTITGVIAGNGGLAKSNGGTLTLTNANTLRGDITVNNNGGILNVQNAGALGTAEGTTTVGGNATLQLQGNINIAEEGLNLGNGGTLQNLSGNNTYSGQITLQPAAYNNWGSSTISSNAGTLLTIAGPVNTAYSNLVVTGSGDTSITGQVGFGSAGIQKNGTGTLILSGVNNYNGTTTVSGGVLGINSDAALGAAYDGSIGGYLTTAGGTGYNVTSTSITIGAPTTDGGMTAVPGTILTQGGATSFNNMSLSGEDGSGYIYNPTVTITSSIGGTGAAVTAMVKGLLTLDGGTLRTDSDITSNRAVVITANNGTIDTNGHNSTFSGIFNNGASGNGGLTKSGLGTLTLTGNNIYTGATNVNGGKLAVNGSIASSAVIVNNGGTLGGSGTTGAVTVNDGGRLAAGNSISTTFKTGALTLNAGSTVDIKLGTASASKLLANSSVNNDRTTVGGALTLGGTLNLIDNANAGGLGHAGVGSYLILANASSVAGNFNNIVDVSGFHASVDKTTVAGNVYVDLNYYARAGFTAVSGGDITPIDATNFTLSLGSVSANSGKVTATITLDNVLQDAIYQDLLSGTFDITGQGAFSLSGFDGTLAAIASGSNVTLTVSFDTANAAVDTYTGSILFNPTSTNASNTAALSQMSLGLQVEVVPEPATWSMIVGGLGMMAFVQRARRRMSR